MRRSRYRALFGLMIVVLVTMPARLLAQIGDPGCDPLCNCRADGSICPIDNGVVALLAIGILYGFFRYWREKNKRTSVS